MKKYYYLIITLFLTTSAYSQGINPSFYALQFELIKYPVKERIKILTDLNYKGIALRIMREKELNELNTFLESPEVKSGKLSIPIVYTVFNEDLGEEKDVLWKQIIEKHPSIPLWLIVKNKTKPREEVIKDIKTICEKAYKKGGEVVIYPHDNTYIESAEEALEVIKEVNMPNLFLTLHLCHEIRARNMDRLLEIAIKVAPYLKFATISGSNISTVTEGVNWADTIKPLDEGDYPVEEFVSILQKINFQGKTVLHTYGIKQEPRDHLSRSIKKWEEMVESTYKDLNENLNLILDAPENACWDPISKTWFISNLGGEKVTIEKDGYGWITRLNENREVISNRWVKGLDAPTGMATYKNHLFVGDRGVLVKIDIEKGQIIEKIKLPDSEFINDVAVDSKGNIYVSDTFKDRIYKLSKKGKLDILIEDSQLEYPNGLWVDGNELVVATWGPMSDRATFETSRKGTLKKVNLKTKQISSIGLSKPIANFDGVVKYKGFYYATDWTGGRLLQISEQGDVKEIMTGFVQFADLGVDLEKGIILVPEMSKNRFIMLNLKALFN